MFLCRLYIYVLDISRIQDSLHAHIIRFDRAGIDTVAVVVDTFVESVGLLSFSFQGERKEGLGLRWFEIY
jgi:hypothetical protein